MFDPRDIEDMFTDRSNDWLSWHEKSFADSMEMLRFYFVTIERLLDGELRSIIQDYKAGLERIPKNKHQDYFEYSYPHWWEDVFDSNLRSSFVINLCSILEVYLSRLCGPSRKDSGHKFIGSCRQHLGEFAGENVTNLDWDTIEKLYKIRNTLVHNEGFLEGKKFEQIKSFVLENEGFVLQEVGKESGLIGVDSSCCKRMLKTVSDFGHQLAEVIRNSGKSK